MHGCTMCLCCWHLPCLLESNGSGLRCTHSAMALCNSDAACRLVAAAERRQACRWGATWQVAG